MSYMVKNRPELTMFLKDAKLPLDNNIAERALRIIAVGRKNFMFVGNYQAGRNLAILQTLVTSCEAHDVNSFEYIRDVLVRIQTHPMSAIDELLPDRWQPPDKIKPDASPESLS